MTLGQGQDEWPWVKGIMNDSKSWNRWMTLGHELKALNATNDSRSRMRRTTLGHKLESLNR